MRISMTVGSVFLTVCGGAMAGMALGAAFGAAAGMISPALFRHVLPWHDVEPLGFAVVLGAFGGVLCGGGLAAFAVLIQCLSQRLNGRDEKTG